MSETSVGMRSADENSNHSNKTRVVLVIVSLRMSRKFSKGSFSITNYRKMLLIKKLNCQIFTKGKCVEDTLQFVEYLLCISGIKVIESIDTIRRHSKPEFYVLIIMN